MKDAEPGVIAWDSIYLSFPNRSKKFRMWDVPHERQRGTTVFCGPAPAWRPKEIAPNAKQIRSVP